MNIYYSESLIKLVVTRHVRRNFSSRAEVLPCLTVHSLKRWTLGCLKCLTMFEWFSFNNLKRNASKCHVFISPFQPVPANVRGSIIESSSCEKLLGIYIDSNFLFEYHINRICRKASQKLYALFKIAKCISEDKKSVLFESFIIHNSTIV